MKYHELKDYLPVIKDRESGMTFQDIADKMGVTRQRVDQIYRKGKLLQRTKRVDPFWGLPGRAVDAFDRLKLQNMEDVKAAVLDGRLHPLAGLNNYRWLTHNQVLAWLKMKPLPVSCNGTSGRMLHTCPKCKHQF